MLTFYCPDCGAKLQYLTVKPRFCSQCAHPFEPQKAKAAAPKRNFRVIEEPEDEEEYEETRGSGPKDYGKPSFQIEGSKPPVYMSQDLIKSPKLGIGSRGPGTSKTGEDLMREIREECAPRRNPFEDTVE